MDIAVIGGGHGCYAAAAQMSENGHRDRMWRRDREGLEELRRAGSIQLADYKGEREVPIALVTDALAEALAGADLVLVPLPATSHVALSRELAPYLEPGQVVYLPPGTFGSVIFAREMRQADNGADVSFVETGTLPYLARKHASRRVVISVYAKRLPSGVFPSRNRRRALAILGEAYPVIEPVEDALSAALMNAGPIIHPPLIVMNAGPLQHFETWDIHNEGTQAAIRRVTTALDAERVTVREALGYAAPHFPLADHYAEDGDEWMYGRAAHDRLTSSGDWREHIDLHAHRYMREDVELGLSLLVSLGQWAGVATPVARGLLSLSSAITGEDLYSQGRTLESLALAHLSRDEMRRFLTEGVLDD